MEIVNNGMTGIHLCKGCDSEIKLFIKDVQYPTGFLTPTKSAAFWTCPVCNTKNELVRTV